jgi:hypothetical protein
MNLKFQAVNMPDDLHFWSVYPDFRDHIEGFRKL